MLGRAIFDRIMSETVALIYGIFNYLKQIRVVSA